MPCRALERHVPCLRHNISAALEYIPGWRAPATRSCSIALQLHCRRLHAWHVMRIHLLTDKHAFTYISCAASCSAHRRRSFQLRVINVHDTNCKPRISCTRQLCVCTGFGCASHNHARPRHLAACSGAAENRRTCHAHAGAGPARAHASALPMTPTWTSRDHA